MSGNFTRRNHHLPQKYQLGFANATGRVHLYDRKRGAYIHGRPKNIGFENDFYTTVTASGEPSDGVEKLLALVEGRSWPLLAKLAQQIDLSSAERSTIAFFVALMRTRTTSFDAFSKNFADVVAKSMLHLFNPTQEIMEQRHEQMMGKALDPDKAAEMFQALQEQKFTVVPPRQNIIKSMLDIASELERNFWAMEWDVYSAPNDCKFVTSDNPLITVPPPTLDTSIQGYGPLTPGALNIMPIDSGTALFLRGGSRRSTAFRRANRDLIREVNIMIASASDRLIIACDEPQLRKLVAQCKPAEWSNSFETVPVSPPWLADRFKKVDNEK